MLKEVVATTMYPLAGYRCIPYDEAIEKSVIVRDANFRISPDGATWHDDFETKPATDNQNQNQNFKFKVKAQLIN